MFSQESELDDKDRIASATGNHIIVHGEKKDDVIAKSIEKIKETSTVELLSSARCECEFHFPFYHS